MTGHGKSGLLLRDVRRQQGNRHIDIHEHTTFGAMDMVVSFDALVETACLVGEGQFLNQAMLGQEMERAVDGAIGYRWIPSPHALENLSRGKMPSRGLDLGLDDRPLSGVAIRCLRSQSHCVTFHSFQMTRPDVAETIETGIVPT